MGLTGLGKTFQFYSKNIKESSKKYNNNKVNKLNNILFYFLNLLFLAVKHILRDFSSLTWPSAVRAQSPNHWTAREFPSFYFF